MVDLMAVAPPLEMVVDSNPPTPEEVAEATDRRKRFDRNVTLFQEHAFEIGETHRGKYICVAGEELFVGDEPQELRAAARAAHPDDWGSFFTKYIPVNRGPVLHANRRCVDSLR